ncbi:glycoside hydrolase family 65 protein [Kytococcus sedentarius]|uniref:Trehalose/maltose hydrolase or phosphorylase n=1 Tax=Kytococcus sedentarius (strain ATCC 14392 / DSM 20547 / JCM 11482 / CCUG 33030 / NBRC 15357 / NCTC 11040 / CCM 314 / 541) TaxID=478801 RepID=C7NKW0_KYTSD|nr:glycosyl hydrolase family 65 protein [Kytococcus sedentarius]ACV07051.1 trehalose/maltose hydrolase or phosphorylase [Kytococcus sedentarius DSM 20547]STX14121.1 Kojibiose phosphorylase [Kytococcus sedentarius]
MTAANHVTAHADGAPRTDPMDRTRFPIDPWRLVETACRSEDLGHTETLFAVANGYLGLRGNPEEGREAHTHGTFVNGVHETWRIKHAEEAYGFAKVGQTIVNAPDAKLMKLYVDDEPFILATADIESYERSLDMRAGTLTRDVVWRTPAGKRVRVHSERLVSFAERHLALLSLEVQMLSGDAALTVSSQILNRQDGSDEYAVDSKSLGAGFDPRKAATFGHRVLQSQAQETTDRRLAMGWRTTNSRMTLGVGVEHQVTTDAEVRPSQVVTEDQAKQVYAFRLQEGQSFRLDKWVSYHSSTGVPVPELLDRCHRTLDRLASEGVAAAHAAQADWLADFWANADVEVPADPAIQQAVRYALFSLAQATGRADREGIPAKGVTGSGYEGHYFWDTEAYVVPFLTYTMPHLARNALHFRSRLLPKARERAADLALEGALFPWRTINGEEASAYYAAGTAQYHIDADVAYALTKYLDATGDEHLARRDAVDILVGTARMWADLGFWRHGDEPSFHIHSVTGPDEYTAVVNNNLFTNVMARYNLERAASALARLAEEDPQAHSEAVERLDLREDEAQTWERLAAAVHIPYDEALGIHPQDEHFLDREIWDLAATPPEKHPLLLHYHPLVIYRYQVLKQADVVLALFLQGDRFTLEQKRANFEYYDPITTGDSTLSAVVQSIMAAEVGYHRMALDYFLRALYVDLADAHSNTEDGMHIANSGGVWSALVSGFGGMRAVAGQLTFDPRLPEDWDEITFRVQWRGSRLRIRVAQESMELTAETGPASGAEPVTLIVRGEPVSVGPETTTVALDGQGERLDAVLSPGCQVGRARADGTVITASTPEEGAATTT